MANETTVLSASLFTVHFDGLPIDGFPAAGVIATQTKEVDEADFIATLHGGGVAVINGSDVHVITFNVTPDGTSHKAFAAALGLQRAGFIHSLNVVYGSSFWDSASCIVQNIGTRSINADNVDFQAVLIKGVFKVNVGSFVAPSVATPEQLRAAMAL